MPCTRYFHHSTTSLSNDSLRPAADAAATVVLLCRSQRAPLVTEVAQASNGRCSSLRGLQQPTRPAKKSRKLQRLRRRQPAGQHWAASGGPACARVQACVHGHAGSCAVLCSRLRCDGLHAAAWEKLQQQARVAAPAGTAGCSAGCSGEVLLLHLLPACDPPLHPHLHSQARQPGSGAFRRQLDSRQPGDQRPPAPTASAGMRVGGGGSSRSVHSVHSARSTHQQRGLPGVQARERVKVCHRCSEGLHVPGIRSLRQALHHSQAGRQ